ncbi:MAG: formylglycine-generating enzyme family protein [Prevotellaceae bacterium]|jgi:formylglycine-generating enzyme required for sulfatase activity|nr:formylglycine-generating enzyme family protein [Prevotellaceae bacterium]
MKQNYKLYLAALLLAGATSMMTAGAQGSGKPTLAVFVVGMTNNTDGDNLATQIAAELNRNSRYTVLSSAADPVKTKLAELRKQGASSIDRNALAAWGREKGVSTICLVTDAIKGSDHMFYALLIDAKDSKVSGRGSYIRTNVVSGDLPRVSLALSRQLDGPGRRRSAPAPTRSYPAELDIEMVQVEGAASVTLGYRATDGSSSTNNVKAAYTASVPSFKIGKYEVTQAQWRAVMAGTKFENYFWWGGSRGTANGALNSANCGNVACDDQRPVEYISWYMALAFCNRLSELSGKTPVYGGFTLADIADNGDCSACGTGANVTVSASANGYRLPTSNEWEYAARGCKAGVCEAFMYSGSNTLGEVGWNATNPDAAFANSATHPVGQLKPNDIGVYDMSSNVWEWCYDIWDSGSRRVFRGGGWDNDVASGWPRVAARLSDTPSYRYPSLGFRVVLP